MAPRMLPRLLPALLLLLATAPASADNTSKHATFQVTLHDGKVLEGRLTWKPTKLYVKGRRTKKIHYREISAIGIPPEPSPDELRAEFAQRQGRLKEDDVKGWGRLGRWAAKRGLDEEAEDCFARVVELDPSDTKARKGLGQIPDDKAEGGWVDGIPVLNARRAELKAGDHDGLVKLARFALKHELRPRAFAYLCEVLRADIFHKDALKLAKPFTDAYRQKHPLVLPVSGRWYASTDPTRHHQKKSYAVYALDLTKVDEEGKGYRGTGKRLEDHYAYGAPFYALAAGTVIEVREGFPDNPIGKIGNKAEKHNGVSIDHGNGELSWYVHAKKGTITVKLGQKVEAGQLLGEVGNSGGSAVPHLHVTLISYRGISVPWACDNYRVIAPDGTPIPVTRAWPREGWTLEADPPPQPAPSEGADSPPEQE